MKNEKKTDVKILMEKAKLYLKLMNLLDKSAIIAYVGLGITVVVMIVWYALFGLDTSSFSKIVLGIFGYICLFCLSLIVSSYIFMTFAVNGVVTYSNRLKKEIDLMVSDIFSKENIVLHKIDPHSDMYTQVFSDLTILEDLWHKVDFIMLVSEFENSEFTKVIEHEPVHIAIDDYIKKVYGITPRFSTNLENSYVLLVNNNT